MSALLCKRSAGSRAARGLISLVLFSAAQPALVPAQVRLKLATTTSTESSGLLGELLPPFEKRCQCQVHVIAVGSGRALMLGRNGEVDLVLVHARALEQEFVRSEYGLNRREVMYNDFVIVGPAGDPAGINGKGGAASAFARIAKSGAAFLSRGDQSGTNLREKEIWQAAGIVPSGGWYLEVGRGMGEALIMADEKQAYTLVDRGTYLAFGEKISLKVLVEGDAGLRNDYSIIAVNPARHPGVNYSEAMRFIAWITSPAGQRIIADFGKEKFGLALFHPAATPAISP